MQTLVEAKVGRVNTAVARSTQRGVAIDRKVELMVAELKRNVTGTCISESKWFGQEIGRGVYNPTFRKTNTKWRRRSWNCYWPSHGTSMERSGSTEEGSQLTDCYGTLEASTTYHQ